MSDSNSPNYAEYIFEKKNEGKTRLLRTTAVLLYIAFILGFFAFCMATKILPLFAIGPFLLYVIILCTWRLVKYENYWKFETGCVELGRIKPHRGERRKIPEVKIKIKEALEVAPYTGQGCIGTAKRVYDYSESQSSKKRVFITFELDGVLCAAVLEASPRLVQLLTLFSKNSHDLKSIKFDEE